MTFISQNNKGDEMFQKVKKFLKFFTNLYIDGFKNMKLGKKLWILIALKLFFLFVVIKWLFFPDVMKENFSTDKERSSYIINQLTRGR